MTKRRRTYRLTDEAKVSIVEFRTRINGMSMDELLVERTRVGQFKQQYGDQFSRACVMLDLLRDALMAKRTDPADFGISEHAVLRYLERVKGLDVRAVKAEIRQYAKKFERKDDLDQIVTTDDGLKIALSNSGVVATVWAESEPRP